VGQILLRPWFPWAERRLSVAVWEMGVIAVDEVGDEPLYLERVAALDIGKAQLEVCIRVPGDRDRRRRAQEISIRWFGAGV
jgi:hypothetical protein